MQMISCYSVVMLVRGVVLALTFPILNMAGLNFDWKKEVVTMWLGIRSPVLLILALMLKYDTFHNPYHIFQQK